MLTPTETKVLRLACLDGLRQKQVADRMGTDVRTVETQKQAIRRKLGGYGKTNEWIALKAKELGLLDGCRKCGGEMKPGKAMQETYTGTPDMGEIVTMSAGGPGRLVDCMKCVECGWSTT